MTEPKPKKKLPAAMEAWKFKPGEVRNPGGKPVGARNRLQGSFLNALADDFDKHGRGAIDYCRRNDPTGYVKICANLMPKQFEQLSPLEELSDGELTAILEHIRSARRGNIDAGTGETESPQSIN
jgi:hypothetical protein